MKTLESRLQNGKVICKPGVSFTKQESYLQNGSLALQMGLLACNLPPNDAQNRKIHFVKEICKIYLTNRKQ